MGTVDRDAFARLVEQHQPALSRFAGRYLRSREDADEVVQETFLRAWRQIDRFRPGSNFAAWLMTIARFLCMARRQDARRHRPPSPLDAVPSPTAPDAPDDHEALRRAFEALAPVHREILALRFFENLDYRAIAEITGDSEVALRSRLHDTLERLRTALGNALER